MANNPDLRVAKADLDTAAVNLKYAHNQVRPDLKLNSGVTWTQNALPFGYGHFYTALDNLFRADTRNGFVSLNYRVPWGNRPAEDALNLAEEQYKQSGKSMSSVATTVSRNVNDAVAGVLSAREQAAIAWKNVQRAEEALRLVKELWEQGRVPDAGQAVKNSPTFTLLLKNNELLSAKLRYIQAQIGLKQAEGQLLAAQGLIAARFADEFKITIKPVVESGSKEAAKPQAEKKEGPAQGQAK
jgi:outer membrane protein TolC